MLLLWPLQLWEVCTRPLPSQTCFKAALKWYTALCFILLMLQFLFAFTKRALFWLKLCWKRPPVFTYVSENILFWDFRVKMFWKNLGKRPWIGSRLFLFLAPSTTLTRHNLLWLKYSVWLCTSCTTGNMVLLKWEDLSFLMLLPEVKTRPYYLIPQVVA